MNESVRVSPEQFADRAEMKAILLETDVEAAALLAAGARYARRYATAVDDYNEIADRHRGLLDLWKTPVGMATVLTKKERQVQRGSWIGLASWWGISPFVVGVSVEWFFATSGVTIVLGGMAWVQTWFTMQKVEKMKGLIER